MSGRARGRKIVQPGQYCRFNRHGSGHKFAPTRVRRIYPSCRNCGQEWRPGAESTKCGRCGLCTECCAEARGLFSSCDTHTLRPLTV